MFWAHRPFYTVGYLYLIVMVAWAVLSWFPIEPGSPVSRLRRTLGLIVQPVLAPIRRIIPPAGIFDVSYLVAFLAVWILTQFVLYRIVI